MKLFVKVMLAAAIGLYASLVQASAADHKLAVHVDQSDPAAMNLALNNLENVEAYYAEKGDSVTIEVVAYGPGLKMYTADSPVRDRISALSLEHPSLVFSACGNTLAAMEKKAGTKIALIAETSMVPSGVVRLMELQEQGYSYVKP
ncbi:hypothetical protein DFR52_101838 [Hoeflea marina]|uniref:Uncharacterized protein n=1 Tax=Hoeflea marina TaxID=274592 RepID=A0A317PT89_9HYPH|nr:DsrE family protein [Hoeflea marina]PWW04147.1 hypothetical protein DFR52_101838 [Hoeflea marina]